MERNARLSPSRLKPRAHSGADGPGTPAAGKMGDRSIHHPSPNRTEAAAAMMHLFTSSTASKSKKVRADAVGKAKRRYVRKVPRKLDAGAAATDTTQTKKAAKQHNTKSPHQPGTSDADVAGGETRADKAHATGELASDLDTQQEQEENESADWKAAEDDVRYFPFREYNRKEKSLGLLCENFLKLYRGNHMTEICLDRAATELGVERRRIYDIVNILESIHLVSRKSKNLYNWHGLGALPVSIAAMKSRYSELQKEKASGPCSYDYNFKDRRRGKSLSKLSQMFVQLFLRKEHCIIPLDQAAKQLIQMEESENEEDRLLKTKIRRLYDVANVLVSVGLIEKLQLSNSRKPVFRWRIRSASESSGEDEAGAAVATTVTHDEHDGDELLQVKLEITSSVPSTTGTADDDAAAAADVKSETASSIDLLCEEDTDALKTSQSSDSDSFDDGSDSQSDCSESGSPKRKFAENEGASLLSSSDAASSKRAKTAPPSTPTAAVEEHEVVVSETPLAKLLRFDASNTPVHPQIVLHEQQEQVRVYMQQYIREYVDFLMAQQASADLSAAAQIEAEADAVAVAPGADGAEASVATITQSIHSTPVTIPSLTNRVTSDMAGSIQDLLFSASTTSPQSVSDVLVAPPAAPVKPSAATPSSTTTSSPSQSAETRILLVELQSTTSTSTSTNSSTVGSDI